MALHTSPTPRELLEGVAHVLRREVAPHLDDPTARDQLNSAVGILRYLAARSDTAVADLVAEADELRALFERAAPALREAGRDDLAARLDGLAAGGAPDAALPYAGLVSRIDALHEGLLDLLLAVEHAGSDGEPAGPLASLRPRVLAALEAVNRRRS